MTNDPKDKEPKAGKRDPFINLCCSICAKDVVIIMKSLDREHLISTAEALDLPEVRNLYIFSGHIHWCKSLLGKSCDCGHAKACEAFDAMKERIKTKEEESHE